MSMPSFEKFSYWHRPSKQVERKVMIELLLKLLRAGYDFETYTYFGFGSVYYVDYVMFHKYLFFRDMICVEREKIPDRMEFNKPYNCIKLRMGSFSDYLDLLKPDQRFVLWLDFDRPLDDVMLRDIRDSFTRLSAGSVFVVTVEARARPVDDDKPEIDDLSAADRDQLMLERYNEWFSPFVGAVSLEQIGEADVSKLFWAVIKAQTQDALANRDLGFVQLLNYWYKDGAPMLTIGGMVCSEEDKKLLRKHKVRQTEFAVRGCKPMIISVPPLTIREKLWLDAKVHKKLKVTQLPFELKGHLLRSYRRFYKQYPTFTEALM